LPCPLSYIAHVKPRWKWQWSRQRRNYKINSQGQEVRQIGNGSRTSFVKKLPKTPKGKNEKTFKPFNLKSEEGGASTKNESSEGEAFKDNVQVVE